MRLPAKVDEFSRADRGLVVVVAVAGDVVDPLFKFAANVIVSFIQKPDQPVDLVTGFLTEGAYGLKDFFGGYMSLQE